jgi:hypothetical protein
MKSLDLAGWYTCVALRHSRKKCASNFGRVEAFLTKRLKVFLRLSSKTEGQDLQLCHDLFITITYSPFITVFSSQPSLHNLVYENALLHNTRINQLSGMYGNIYVWWVSHRGGRGFIPCQVMWDSWWTKWHWGRFFWVRRFPLPILIP